MKTENKGQDCAPVAAPLLQDLIEREKTNFKLQNPSIGEKPISAPDLYQDAGGSYNLSFIFPQE